MVERPDSCRHCGNSLEKDDLFCGQCGCPVTEAEERKPREEPVQAVPGGKRRWFLAGIAACMLLLALASAYLLRDRIKLWKRSARAPHAVHNVPLHPAPVPQPSSLQPSAPSTLRPEKAPDRAYYENAANAAYRKRDCGVLKNVLDKGLERYPGSAKLWGGVAGYNIVCRPELSAAVRGRSALNAALRAYQLDGSDQNAVNVGWIFQSLFGDCRNAVAFYEKGLPYAERDPSLYYHMGQCHESLGQAPKAVECYRLFLRSAPNHKYAPTAGERLSALAGEQ